MMEKKGERKGGEKEEIAPVCPQARHPRGAMRIEGGYLVFHQRVLEDTLSIFELLLYLAPKTVLAGKGKFDF